MKGRVGIEPTNEGFADLPCPFISKPLLHVCPVSHPIQRLPLTKSLRRWASPSSLFARPRRTDVTRAHVRELQERGFSLREIAGQLRAGYGTVRKVLDQPANAPQASENPRIGSYDIKHARTL